MTKNASLIKILNIFAIHLGCDVHFLVDGVKKRGKIVSVDFNRETVDIETTGKSHNYTFKLNPNDNIFLPSPYEAKDCKIILRKITKILEEDGKILEKYFLSGYRENKELEAWDYDLNAGGFLVYYKNGVCGTLFDIDAELGLLLASLGYDINIVPDELKEIVK